MLPDDGRVISNFIVQALHNQEITLYGDGKQYRSFCYVSDLIDGLIKLFFSENLHEPVNLGNPEPINIFDLASEIVTLTKSKSKLTYRPLPEDDPRIREPNIDKARSLLSWEPKISRVEGLTKTIKYFKKHLKDFDVEIDDLIVEEYTELDLKKHFILGDKEDDDREDKFSYLYQEIRRKLLQINSDSFYVTDVLIKYLYFKKKSQFKTTLWSCFGDILVENLKRNVATKQKYCEVCGDLIKQVTNNQEYCKKCWSDKHREIKRTSWHKNKSKYKN
jgi:hypothetical protein